MTQKIIGFFCGTGYDAVDDENSNYDASLKTLRENVDSSHAILAYDGCHVHGGGLFSYGVEEQADAFIQDLKQNLSPDETKYQINLVAHSRGVLSALLAIKKIQADPELCKKVTITADFHDPVPGNFQITTKIAGELASANQLRDLTDCNIVKKVNITLQEEPILPIAFDMLIPKFHHAATVEIETIPGIHDVQQRFDLDPWLEHSSMMELGIAKTFAILQEDGFTIDSNYHPTLRQLLAYEEMVKWARTRSIPFGERDLHFGGQIIANNSFRKIDVINWRHAKLLNIQLNLTPDHVLYGTTQPDYNYRKTLLEHACDVFISLDRFAVNNPDKKELIETIRAKTRDVSNELVSVSEYKAHIKLLLELINAPDITKAVNYLCMMDYFKKFDQILGRYVRNNSILVDELQTLKVAILDELTVEIESGKTIEQLNKSNAVKIINNTVQYLDDIGDTTNPEEVINISEQYANDNIRLGRNWNRGSKIITGAIIALAATVVGLVVGLAAGFAIGWAIGAVSGPGAIITACVAAFIGGLAGAATGIYIANHFFKASPVEKQIQTIRDISKADALKQMEEEPSLSFN